MNQDDLKGLRFYLVYCAVLIAFFVYSAMTGWKWFNPTKTEPTHSTTPRGSGIIYRYHK